MTTTTETKQDHAQEQAAAQYSSIVDMLAAVGCDFDRLEELRDERDDLAGTLKDAETEHAQALEEVAAAEARHAVACASFTSSTKEAEALKEARATLEEAAEALEAAREAVAEWNDDNAEELAELEEAAGDCDDEEDARQRIQEDPLSVEVRSDWASPGEELTAGEFCILLCTGGPAVRIRGELDGGTPCRAWLEYQDWGTPWTQYFEANSATLCEYAGHFFSE